MKKKRRKCVKFVQYRNFGREFKVKSQTKSKSSKRKREKRKRKDDTRKNRRKDTTQHINIYNTHTLKMNTQGNQAFQQGNAQQANMNGFDQFNHVFQQNQQQQQYLQQQYVQNQAQQPQQPAQVQARIPDRKDPPKLIEYHGYNDNDRLTSISLVVTANTSKVYIPQTYCSCIRKVSPKVIYDTVDGLLDGRRQARSIDRFTSGECFGAPFRQIGLKSSNTVGFFSSSINPVLDSTTITRDYYDDLMKYFNLDDVKHTHTYTY